MVSPSPTIVDLGGWLHNTNNPSSETGGVVLCETYHSPMMTPLLGCLTGQAMKVLLKLRFTTFVCASVSGWYADDILSRVPCNL
jgi:hypothetical protein